MGVYNTKLNLLNYLLIMVDVIRFYNHVKNVNITEIIIPMITYNPNVNDLKYPYIQLLDNLCVIYILNQIYHHIEPFL